MKLSRFDVDKLLKGEPTSFVLPMLPKHCTVLGYNVTAKSPMWTGLRWDHEAWIDGGRPHLFMPDERTQYLHVAHESDGVPLSDGVRYRVRSKLCVGDMVVVFKVGECDVKAVSVAGIINGKWHWRYEISPRPANGKRGE